MPDARVNASCVEKPSKYKVWMRMSFAATDRQCKATDHFVAARLGLASVLQRDGAREGVPSRRFHRIASHTLTVARAT